MMTAWRFLNIKEISVFFHTYTFYNQLENMLDLKNITKSYQVGEEEIQVLKNIDLTIQDGEFVAIM